MISLKLQGFSEVINKLKDVNGWIPASSIDAIVKGVATPLVERIKSGYVAGGHKKTGALVSSIMAFKRKRKGNEPYFTYYVGPRYGNQSTGSWGGNAAHLIEYGTAERFRANTKKGGVGKKQGFKGVYGAKFSTGRVKGFGVIRKAKDEYAPIGMAAMKTKMEKLIIESAKKANIAA